MKARSRFVIDVVEAEDGSLHVAASKSRDDQPGKLVPLSRRQAIELLSVAATAFSGEVENDNG